jgi:hypothetical protein
MLANFRATALLASPRALIFIVLHSGALVESSAEASPATVECRSAVPPTIAVACAPNWIFFNATAPVHVD